MKRHLLALLVSSIVHISFFALIIYLYDVEKTIIPQTNQIPAIKIALVVSPKKATIPQEINKKNTPKKPVSPVIPTQKRVQKTNKKYAKKRQPTPQVTHTKKRTDPELDSLIRAYQQNLPQSQPTLSKNITQQSRLAQNNTVRKPTTKKITPSIVPEKIDHINNEAEQRYKARLRMMISQKKHYPKRAKRTQKEGVITLSFIIYADGTIENIRFKKRSGYKILDQAAIKTIQQLSGSLPFPMAIKRKQWSFILPIVYRLH
jgi:protein TonB